MYIDIIIGVILCCIGIFAFNNTNTIIYVVRFLWSRSTAVYRSKLNLTVSDLFENHANNSATKNKTCIIFEDQEYSYSEFDRIANAVSNIALSHPHFQRFIAKNIQNSQNVNQNKKQSDSSEQGVGRSSRPESEPKPEPEPVVALVFESRPEFIALWLGLAKIGIKSALINATIRGAPLLHAMSEANATMIIYGEECYDQVADVLGEINELNIPIYALPDMPLHAYNDTIGKQYQSNIQIAIPPPIKSTLEVNTPDILDSYSQYETLLKPTTPHPFVKSFLPLLMKSSSTQPSKSYRSFVQPKDTLFYIYTSGTTGLPKAAKINHSRFEMAGLSYKYMHWLSSSDIIYCSLPLYHSAGGMLGLSTSWFLGSTIVIRRKFSASAFFKDCVKYNVTVIQYIGQLCRYLLSSPKSEADTAHKIHSAIGNGLRSDVWVEFQKRYKIPYIGEFYGSTEGNCSLVNTFGKEGACGFLPPLTRPFYPVRIIKIKGEQEQGQKPQFQSHHDQLNKSNGKVVTLVSEHEITNITNRSNSANPELRQRSVLNTSKILVHEDNSNSGSRGDDVVDAVNGDDDGDGDTYDPMDPVRQPNGLCIEADFGESGELLGKIVATDPYRNWEGYSNKKESEKKVLYDVFEKGDAWFRTGDLMKMDSEYFIYFMDRLGDTYRWKGENIACTEIENEIAGSDVVEDAIAYGVTVDGYDGRAGMVSIVLKSNSDKATNNDKANDIENEKIKNAFHPVSTINYDKIASDLCTSLSKKLATWQMPVFVQFVDRLDMTATLKHNKVAAQKRGWSSQYANMYVLDSRSKTYLKLTPKMEGEIRNGTYRL